MLAYEFYQRDKEGNSHLIGILPERRKDKRRIDKRAITNWLAQYFDEKESGDIYFIEVEF